MDTNRVIGNKGDLPWHIPEDLKRFKKLTLGHPVIMGRKTFESIGRPLPERTNIVITRNKDFTATGITVADSLSKALTQAKNASGGDEIFVIGGAQVFKEAFPQAQKLYVTEVHHTFQGDTYFPYPIDDNEWNVLEKTTGRTGDMPYHYTFVTYMKR